jgi:hypothetical protein
LLSETQYVGKDATKAKAAIPAPDVFAEEVKRLLGNAAFFVDASELAPTAIADIAAACRKRGLSLIPATTLGAPSSYDTAIAKVISIDKRGLALRVDLNELATAASWASKWSHSTNATDLIADFSDNVANVVALGVPAVQAFHSLHNGTSWRTVTVAGASMPENFTGYQKGLHELDRHEWALWKKLNGAKLPYAIDYGDYATVSVAPAPEGIRWGFPINVRYTLSQKFLICRGVKTTGVGAVAMATQLLQHAKSIVAYPPRNALAHCTGDLKIDSIASGNASPGGLPGWVAISVNRHIELARSLLP